MKAMFINTLCAAAAVAAVVVPATSQAQGWEPTKTVEFIIPAGTGGGADQMARAAQAIIAKHNKYRLLGRAYSAPQL